MLKAFLILLWLDTENEVKWTEILRNLTNNYIYKKQKNLGHIEYFQKKLIYMLLFYYEGSPRVSLSIKSLRPRINKYYEFSLKYITFQTNCNKENWFILL